jgi:hypothetical protein
MTDLRTLTDHDLLFPTSSGLINPPMADLILFSSSLMLKYMERQEGINKQLMKFIETQENINSAFVIPELDYSKEPDKPKPKRTNKKKANNT